MSKRSIISAVLGTAVFAIAASANAGTVTVNNSTASATGVGAITKSGVTVTCNVTFNLTGTVTSYPVPPTATVAQVGSATFTAGSTLCAQVQAIGVPWATQATAVPSAGKVDLTFTNVTLRTQALGDCGPGDVRATYDAASNTATFPAFTLPGANPANTCSSNGFTLNVSPSGLLSSTP